MSAFAETQIPTQRALVGSRVFSVTMVALCLAALALNLSATPDQFGLYLSGLTAIAVSCFAFGIGLLALYMRGDYILRMFGIMWPLWLVAGDEFQVRERQRAFSFAYLVLLNVVLGLTVLAALAVVLLPDQTFRVSDVLASVDVIDLMALAMTVLILTAVLPQGYLAWTLTPLDEDAA